MVLGTIVVADMEARSGRGTRMYESTEPKSLHQGVGMPNTRQFLAWIEEYKRRKGWNSAEFAKEAGVDHSVLSRWRDGRRRPRPEVLERMATKLGVDREELLRLAGYGLGGPERSQEHAELIAKLEQVQLSPDRFRILEALLDYMRLNP
jgi:transcriptional regulator with XRE-family HTH domain